MNRIDRRLAGLDGSMTETYVGGWPSDYSRWTFCALHGAIRHDMILSSFCLTSFLTWSCLRFVPFSPLWDGFAVDLLFRMQPHTLLSIGDFRVPYDDFVFFCLIHFCFLLLSYRDRRGRISTTC